MQRLGMILTFIGLFLIGGCESLNIRPASDTDIVELQQRADKAYQAGDWPGAEQAYSELTELDPDAAEPWYRLGNVHVHLNQPGRAFAAYGEALNRQPEHARAWHNLGILQLRQATRSFLYLEQVTAAEDPLHQRARSIIDNVTDLLERELSTGPAPATSIPRADDTGQLNQNRLENDS